MELIADIAAVVAPVFVISLIGYIWAKIELPFDQAMVLQIIILVSTPCLVFVTLTSMALPPGEIGRMGMAALIATSPSSSPAGFCSRSPGCRCASICRP